MKTTILTRAVAVPALLLIGLGASVLMASPALAAGATPASGTTTSATPATATPAATSRPAAAPSTGTPASPQVPAPVFRVISPTPADPNSDNPTPVQMTSRTFDITGTAPIGSPLEVDDDDGNPLATQTTTATTFTIPITLNASAPYLQYLTVYSTTNQNDFAYLVLEFPAATSATPTFDSPTDGTTFEAAPLPLGLGSFGKAFTFSGTGTPGDNVVLFFTAPGSFPDTNVDAFDSSGSYGANEVSFQNDIITVNSAGNWSGTASLPYGTTSVTALQGQFSSVDGELITHQSLLAATADLTVNVPAGTILPPVITTPAYTLSGFEQGGGFVGTGTSSFGPGRLGTGSSAAASLLIPGRQAPVAAVDPWSRVRKGEGKAADRSKVAKTSSSPRRSGSSALDIVIATGGIPVKGTPSAAHHGYLTTTVAGTGTPGDHIVLYSDSSDALVVRLAKIYPTLFRELNGLGSSLTDPTPVNTAALPPNDDSITVAPNGTWTTTVLLKPGTYGFVAFDVPSGPTPTYSVASNLIDVKLTGTPILDPAATTTELAFTGSNATPTLIVGAGLLAAGTALLLLARRRRRIG